MKVKIQGANEHNLQDFDVEFGDGLTVVTGISGSGKTSLVFDTLYHEARRRFLDIFSPGSGGTRLLPANARSITGLGPAVAVGQNLLNRNPNSTLATASGLHPFLRLLYARFGKRHCAQCGAELSVLTEDEIAEWLVNKSRQAPLTLFAPIVRGVQGSHRTLLEMLTQEFEASRLYVDGKRWVDAMEDSPAFRSKLFAAKRLKPPDSPPGRGKGWVAEFDATTGPFTHPNPSQEGNLGSRSGSIEQKSTTERGRGGSLDPTRPHDIEIEIDQILKTTSVAAIRPMLRTAWALGAYAVVVRGTEAGQAHEWTLSRAPVCASCGSWFSELTPVHFHTGCPQCKGKGCQICDDTGLHPEAAAVRWQGLRLPDLLALTVDDVRNFFRDPELRALAARLHHEIERRLDALSKVGLGYISLDRSSPTLSRGEAQRVRLAVVLTSRLEDMLHVLDEPTIGQHPADVARLLPVFRELAGPVVYVEHDRIAAAVADHALDLGPGAGSDGGRVIFSGTPAGLWEADTPSGRYFSLREQVHTPEKRPEPDAFLTIRNAHLRTLQHLDVAVPIGRLTVVTGVSGSGKSTLVEDVLVASLTTRKPTGCQALEGPHSTPVFVDQSPIGLNPRSNPATYTKLADTIRDCFAAKTGLSPSHFSFNRPEGACPECKGMGAVEVRMRYLPSIWIPCSACDGQRFSDEVLAARADFGGRWVSIAEFYDLSVREATSLLLEHGDLSVKHRRTAGRILRALCDIGLGYLSLGQPSPTLSGGEAQRIKLAKYLGKKQLSKELFILDEPSTGLHPQNIAGLLTIFDRLVRAGATVVVIEHNTDIIRAADWIIDLGPGAGSNGGRLLYAGSPEGILQVNASKTSQALQCEADITPSKAEVISHAETVTSIQDTSSAIVIRDARAHNLKGVDVDFPKGAVTIVTGVSGSGKSSLVGDVLEAEAKRRFLETLSLYERQSTREGAEAPVGSVTGLGVAITVAPDRRAYNRRATVGTATEIAHHLAVLLAWVGKRQCPTCQTEMQRVTTQKSGQTWLCPSCQTTLPVAQPRHFSPTTYAAACLTCHGVGTLQHPAPHKLIIHPDKPLCAGAMYSPGFFPKGYLGKPFNHGYDLVQALAARYGFDPMTTPWNRMSEDAHHAFLFGDPEPMEVIFQSRTRTFTSTATFPGFYAWIGEWDVGGTYTDTHECPECHGAKLRPDYLAVTLAAQNIHQLSEMPLFELLRILQAVPDFETDVDAACHSDKHLQAAQASFLTVLKRLRFLGQVGLGYLHLNRVSATLSAGEAQRIKLAGLLGSGLTSLTILLDEPSRGLHPSEVEGLLAALRELRDEGNTVIVIEHDPTMIQAADQIVDVGPGAGVEGGQIVAQGTLKQIAKTDTITAQWLRGERRVETNTSRREFPGWLTIRGACEHNLHGEDVSFPLGALVGVCGVSGSGKSTLLIDTLGRALAPKKHTTSVAYEPLEPGQYDTIENAPQRAFVVDQARKGIVSAAAFLDVEKPLRKLYAASSDARALGITEKQLSRGCSACNGRGTLKIDMGFLPAIHTPCETCRGTGYIPEAWDIRLRGVALPELFGMTIDEVCDLFEDEDFVTRPLRTVQEVGLGYLVLRQSGYALSGGEVQRLKIAKELRRKTFSETLYILDEPTVGQHLEDVARLNKIFHKLVEAGHTVVVVEHHPHLLVACDWLVELGPGGGPDGGRVIATGTPLDLAVGNTPIAPYLREILQG